MQKNEIKQIRLKLLKYIFSPRISNEILKNLEENHDMTHNIIVWIRTGMNRIRIRVTEANQSVRIGNMGVYGRCAQRTV